ncbi:ribosomal protein S18-alanine N-acetyltransferase [Moraxella marmotae]|uniref:ribosomal protein S18-alanine N-acetyltransferase n=1 Tax=Moraxella marmotae TaxID=3344520 RepID=UPI0035F4F35B
MYLSVIQKNQLTSQSAQMVFGQIIAQIAELESLLLPDDAWCQKDIDEILGQFGAGLVVMTNRAIDWSGAEKSFQIEQNYQARQTDETTQNLKAPIAVLGYCLYQIVFETGELHRIGVSPSHQRQSIASRLIAALISTMQQADADNLLLEVRADNLPAIALYRRMGFGEIAVRKGYYQVANRRVDAQIMQYLLS